jgi:anti-sigma B factor antagonist
MLPQGVEIEQQGSLVKVRFAQPEVTHTDMQTTAEECLERVRVHGAQNIAFDLARVEFLASACIGALVQLLQEMEPRRGKVALADCQDNVAFLVKVTRLDAIFEIFDDMSDAIASLKADVR